MQAQSHYFWWCKVRTLLASLPVLWSARGWAIGRGQSCPEREPFKFYVW